MMASRIAGVFALVGGVAWVLKFALIWQNGGTNTTEGLVGVLFDIGAVGVLLAALVRVWYTLAERRLRYRLVALLAAVLTFAAAVNLPIMLGWLLFGRTWLAEEVGVLPTAVAAIILGTRWVISGRARRAADATG